MVFNFHSHVQTVGTLFGSKIKTLKQHVPRSKGNNRTTQENIGDDLHSTITAPAEGGANTWIPQGLTPSPPYLPIPRFS